MKREISNNDDVINSRDVIERLDALESDLQDAYDEFKMSYEDLYENYLNLHKVYNYVGWLVEVYIKDESDDLETRTEKYEKYLEDNDVLDYDSWVEGEAPEFEEWLENEDSDDAHEYKILKTLDEEGSQYNCDWKWGCALIRDSYFVKHCEDFVKDCGYIPKDFPDFITIDWEDTADNLKVDYVTINFDGVEYYLQSM